MPNELDQLLTTLTQLCHTCVALIMRPRLLQRLLEVCIAIVKDKINQKDSRSMK